MATNPAYPGTPHIEQCAITTAESSRTAPTNTGTFFTAAATGSVCYRAFLKAQGSTNAGLIFIYLHDGGSNFRLIKEIPTTTTTVSATVPSWEDELSFSDMIMESGWTLRAATQNGDDFYIVGVGADF